ncbi:MAG: hypothetical protein ACJBCI_06850 [Candidatus Tisiphia sp.]|jgi:hypothetical protein|nr:MAG: hypothetical protein LF884_02460 [Rickettsia endosymbiont of Cimex lectularius]
MSFTIDVKSDINKIARYMDNIEKKQLPFAVNLTLNKIALLVQEQICKRVPIIFNNSKKWWDKHQRTGIKVAFASKYALISAVYTKAHFAYIQEEGGIKVPYRGSMIAVPTSNVPKKQRSSKALRDQQGNRSIFKLGKSIYRRVSSQRLERLYGLTHEAKVNPRFGFKATAVNTFNSRFDKVFTTSFNFALDTAK